MFPESSSDSPQLSASSDLEERQSASAPKKTERRGNSDCSPELSPATGQPEVDMSASPSSSPKEQTFEQQISAKERGKEGRNEDIVLPAVAEKDEIGHEENIQSVRGHAHVASAAKAQKEENRGDGSNHLADGRACMPGLRMEEERERMFHRFQVALDTDTMDRNTEREQIIHHFEVGLSTDETERNRVREQMIHEIQVELNADATAISDFHILESGHEQTADSQEGKIPPLPSMQVDGRETENDVEDSERDDPMEDDETGMCLHSVETNERSDENSCDSSLQRDKPPTEIDDTEEREAKNRGDDFVTEATSSWVDVTETDDVVADMMDDGIMSHSNVSSSPTPSTSSLPHDHRSPDSATLQPNIVEFPRLPDVISSHGSCEPATPVRLNDFYCSSAESRNYIHWCDSSDNASCQKRNTMIFPELVADVGGCLCSRCDLHDRLPEGWPDVFDEVLPDLIVSHGFHESENCSRNKMTLGKTILVTGGAGYIGSHTVIELTEAGYDIIVVDNLVNASMESVRRVEKIVGKKITSYSVDLLNKAALEEVFRKHAVSAVIHFAGLKAVGESCELPLLYYKTNVGGTTNLLEVMEANKVYNIVFSSSATVYGKPQFLPLTESHPVGGCTNPYGKTKFMVEQMLNDLASSSKNWNIVILRYFNPVGAHISGTIGEDPSGVPNNLMPFIGQVAVGRRSALKVYGSDYDTHDGTGVRDYIHVVDLAQGHLAALRKLREQCGLKVYNLGTGQGCSVLDMIKAFEKASGKKIPYEVAPRRAGDVPAMYSDPSLAAKELGWSAKKGLDVMCTDLWRWQSQNPHGYNVDIKK